MSNVYERLGVPTIINAKGTATRVSGAPMPAEIAAAMQEATEHCVDMAQLQGRASEIIAQATGAEAGTVTAGASAGLLLGTAACLAGLDPARMNRLPDTTGMRDEAVVVRSQRNFYDHAVRAAGAHFVEVAVAPSARDARGGTLPPPGVSRNVSGPRRSPSSASGSASPLSGVRWRTSASVTRRDRVRRQGPLAQVTLQPPQFAGPP